MTVTELKQKIIELIDKVENKQLLVYFLAILEEEAGEDD